MVTPLPRAEDDRGGSDPVSEEALGRDDPHGFLPERLRPHRPPALHGQPPAEVCAVATPQHHPPGGFGAGQRHLGQLNLLRLHG